MRSLKFGYLAILLMGTVGLGTAQVSAVKISAAYGGGGGSTANTYVYDYVELYNSGTLPADLTGTSLQYGSATGMYGSSAGNALIFNSGPIIPANRFLLIQTSTAGTPASGALTLPTPDITTSGLSMSGTNGKVALITATTNLNTKPAPTDPSIIDTVSWGTADNAEGGAATNGGAALTATQVNLRKGSGATDTNNNNADFDIATVSGANAPRNSSSGGLSSARDWDKY